MSEIQEAEEFIREAQTKLESKSSFFGLITSGPKYDEAVELLTRAGNLLKGSKVWKRAGDVFVMAAETDIKAGEVDASARKYLNAASCYKKSNPDLAVDCLNKANEIFIRNGRFHIAATHEKEIAEIYEQQLEDLAKAREYYLKAADRYSIEDSQAIAQGCWIKAAMLSAQIDDYEQAADIFEENASNSMTDALRKYSVKDYLLRAGLCRLCMEDIVGAKKQITERYLSIDSSFAGTKDYNFLAGMIEKIEEGDVDGFTQVVADYDKTNVMDDWKTKLLLKIKRGIDEEPSLT